MYNSGRGVSLDYAEAVKWFRLSAGQGYAFAQTTLGNMYRDGRGVPQDFAMAHMWYNLAAASDDGYGRKNRNRLARLMTPDQIAEAQRLPSPRMDGATSAVRGGAWGRRFL
jgi:TPR repeat protein